MPISILPIKNINKLYYNIIYIDEDWNSHPHDFARPAVGLL